MYQLYLMRHAKSSWNSGSTSDFGRPLNPRGQRDAPFMAQWLQKQSIQFDLILASPAERARQTVAGVVDGLGYGGEIWWEERIYDALADDLLDIINTIPDDYGRVLMVGHNPGFSDCVTALCGEMVHMPTAAIAAIELPVTHWREVRPGGGTLLWHVTPKMLK